MNKESKKLKEPLIAIGETEEIEIENISNYIDEIIDCEIEDERTISHIFDIILSILFIEDDRKRGVFHKLSNYCRKFNKKLADDYEKILEEDLNDDYEESLDNDIDYEKVAWYEEGINQFTSSDRDILQSEEAFKKFFIGVKRQTKQIPNLNKLKDSELLHNKLYNDLSYLAISFLSDVMTEEDFINLKYDAKRIEKYGEKILNDMFDYYTEKFKL